MAYAVLSNHRPRFKYLKSDWLLDRKPFELSPPGPVSPEISGAAAELPHHCCTAFHLSYVPRKISGVLPSPDVRVHISQVSHGCHGWPD